MILDVVAGSLFGICVPCLENIPVGYILAIYSLLDISVTRIHLSTQKLQYKVMPIPTEYIMSDVG